MQEDEKKRLDRITQTLHGLLKGQTPPQIETEDWPPDELSQLANYVNQVLRDVDAIAHGAHNLAQGYLDQPIGGRSAATQALKAFQSTLRHVVWQTEQVAKGDYGQRVAFLGKFSASFNRMIERLSENRRQINVQLTELERLATMDPLTGVKNRRTFEKLASSEVNRCQRYGRNLSVVILDLDHFKKINDTYGHHAGDEALKATVDCCQQGLREQDVLARIGGEEFAVLLPETDVSAAMQVAERLRTQLLEHEISYDGENFRLTASFGVAETDGREDFDEVLKRADRALYRAKQEGRNRVTTA